jgi:hypothetical protein
MSIAETKNATKHSAGYLIRIEISRPTNITQSPPVFDLMMLPCHARYEYLSEPKSNITLELHSIPGFTVRISWKEYTDTLEGHLGRI